VSPVAPRASYGANVPERVGGGVLSGVESGSPGDRAGLRVGDVLVAAGGQDLHDVLDWQWVSDDSSVEVSVRRGSSVETLTLSRDAGEAWGIAFRDAIFDGVRTCNNHCVFCFMTQLPKGLRSALYLRDDDYRLSFLQGNFITLTNLTDSDVERIAEQHLSPLYVSLHAVDSAIRETLIHADDDHALDCFDTLLDAGIDFHVQIVLVPGVNDGGVLDESLRWLAAREGVLSVGLVPLGFTAHQTRFSASYGDGAVAAGLIDQVVPWQDAFRKRDGIGWVYLADELYLSAGREVPAAEAYDGYPQYENGIGLVRSFIDDFAQLRSELATAAAALPAELTAGLLTGELFAPVLEAAVAQLPAPGLHVVPVQNRFFGGNVSVTGLLTSADILSAIAQTPEVNILLVPSIVANADGLLLDDVAAAELGTRSGKDVRLISCDAGGLLGALQALAADTPSTHKE
jgi:putative radical SAM enzyme (TIGR03279 family)